MRTYPFSETRQEMRKLSMAERATKVNSILRLGTHERQSELSNWRNEKMHFQACWTLVFSRFYGDFRLAHYVRPQDQAAVFIPPAPDAPKPQWFIDKYSRPMRKVVKTCKGFDLLSCGHKITSPGDGSTAKHRRCKLCKGIPPAENSRTRADQVCKKVDKALTQIPRKVAQSVGLSGRRKRAGAKA